MRGWRCIGRVDHDGYISSDLPVPDGAVLGFSHREDGPLRCGTVRAADVRGRFYALVAHTVPALASNDFIFVATAIGEHAFKRGGS